MKGSVHNFLQHRFANQAGLWYPVVSVYYLTYACNFRCPYFSDGSGQPYHAIKNTAPKGDEVVEILRSIRKFCENLVITGGEPLLHGDVEQVLRALPAMKFDHTILTTNGERLPPFLPAMQESLSELVISLDTLNAERADRNFGRGEGMLRKILDNLEEASTLPKRRFDIVISAVVTPDNLEELYALSEFCWERGLKLAACPQLQGVKVHAELHENEAYRRFFDHLLAAKRKGRPVQGTIRYLECMRDLQRFDCHPFTMLVVSPQGDVFYPCLEIGHHVGKIQEVDDLHALRRAGEERFGPQPQCGNQCHSACALGFSKALEAPMHELVAEGYWAAREKWAMWRGRS